MDGISAMYNRKLQDSKFLLNELAKLTADELKRFIRESVPLQIFRTVKFEQKIRQSKLNPYDYICFALVTNNTRLINNGKLQKCIDWLQHESLTKDGRYDALVGSLQSIWNIKDSGNRPKAKATKGLLLDDCYLNLQRTRMHGAALANMDFRCSSLRLAELQKSDLRFTNFESVEMEGALFWDADLSNISAKNAQMYHCSFNNANMQHADLRFANLQSARLSRTRLFHANLCGANLEKANLEKADLRGANLVNANLTFAEFTGANLAGAKFFTHELLSNEKLIPYLNRLARMLHGNIQQQKLRQYIAIDLSNEARKLHPKQQQRVLHTAYNHRFFQYRKNQRTVSLLNLIHHLFRPRRRNYIETKAQFELARHMNSRNI